MDGDTSDTTTGVGDSLNGETKPDPAKLAQTAIIKQDVMLSGTSTQSPVSSVLTMPTVSMPAAISMATGSASSLPGAASLHGTLPDNLFLSAVPSAMTNDTATAHTTSNADKNDVSGASSNTTHTLSNQTQLLGQPQVAPQFIVAGQALQSQGAGAAAMPMQQLLIPVSTGNGTQQLLSIPVSLAGGGNHQIQLLTTSNGQIIATNLANLAGCGLTQPINVTIPTNAGAPSQSIASSSAAASVTQGITQSISSTNPVSNSALVAAHQPTPTVTPTAAMPQLITNAQGQIVAIGAPQVLPNSVPASQIGSRRSVTSVTFSGSPPNEDVYSRAVPSMGSVSSIFTSLSQPLGSVNSRCTSLTQPIGSVLPQSVSMTHNGTATGTSTVNTAQLPQNLVTTAASQPQVITATQQLATQAALQISQSPQVVPTTQLVQSMAGTTVVAQPTLAQQVVTAVTQASTTNSLPPNVNQLLPNTVSNSTESTTVDGINLDEIKEFAKQFKIRRLSLGLTQTQVGQALSATEGPAYSQSAICRFEKLDITPKSAQKIKPVLERWMMEAEERYKNGMQNLTDFIGSEPSKKRKRRTSFTPQALEILNEHFERNTHPSGAEMTELSGKLNYNREVIRVWFCNKRQALKNTIKKLQA